MMESFRSLPRLAVAMVLGASLLQASAAPELRGTPEELRAHLHPVGMLVALSGEATETAYADRAIVSLVVTTEEDELEAALAANVELRATIARRLAAAGIAAEDIATSKFSMSPQFGWFGRDPSSYEVVNRVAVTIDDESLLRTLAGIADENDEVTIADTSFEHSQEEAMELRVREKALDGILRQKRMYEQRLGLRLEPVRFSEPSVRRRGTPGASIIEEVVVTGQRVGAGSRSASYGDLAANTQPSFDEIEYQASLVVEFRVVGTEAQ